MVVLIIMSLVVDATVLYGGDGPFGSYDGDVAAADLAATAGVQRVFKERFCNSLTFAIQYFKTWELKGNDLN